MAERWKLWNGWGPAQDGLMRVLRIGPENDYYQKSLNASGGVDIVGAEEVLVLAAATSELLEACKEAKEALHFTREYVGEAMLPAMPGWSWYDAICALDAAIAKAKGDSHEATNLAGTG